MAPPMMMLMGAMNGRSSPVAGNGYGQMGGNMMSAMANSNKLRGGMRRANQRPMEKKMSPAMMNAMLNKMLSAKQQEKDGASYMKPAAMAMMMKSPAGAEMLANMMMPQMMSGAMGALPAAKRDQYKRMMMDAIMQQQQTTSGDGDYSAQDQQQQSMDSFGGQQMSPKSGGYGMMTKMGAGSKQAGSSSGSGSGYDSGEQQKQMGQARMGGMKSGGAGDYEGQQEQQEQQRQSMDGYGNDQQQMMMPAMMAASPGRLPMGSAGRSTGKTSMAAAAYPPSAGSAMMSPAMMEQRKQMGAQGYDMVEQQQQQEQRADMSAGTKFGPQNQGGYSSTEAGPAMDQMQAPMMGAGKMGSPMNGFRQAYNQQPMDKSGVKSMSAGEGSYGPMQSMARPMQGYGQAMDNSQQDQQQQDEYGSAPMGQAEPFAFDYKIEDDYGNGQYRKEESDKNGVVRGSYGYTDVSGIYRHVEYVADENGFRANIKSNEPGLSSETTKSANSQGQTMQTMEPVNQSGMAGSESPMAGSSGDTQQQQQQQQMQYSGQSQSMSDNKKKA